MTKRMKKLSFLECWETIPPGQENFQSNKDIKLFVFLARIFEYYMQQVKQKQERLISADVAALKIFYSFYPEHPIKRMRAVLDIATWLEVIAPFDFSAGAVNHDKLTVAFPIFAKTLQKAFDFYQISGNWQGILDGMQAKNFMFSETIKKINQDWSFRWRYIDPYKDVEFYFYNGSKHKEVLMCLQNGMIMPKEWFGGFSLEDEQFKVAKRLSDQYWLFDLKTERCRYVHPRAEAGEAHSQYNLARDYLWRADLKQGKHWLEKAAVQGFPRAIKLLERINAPDFDIKRDKHKRFI